MIFLGLIWVQSVTSKGFKFPKPKIDLREKTEAQKSARLKKAGYPDSILDIKTDSFERNHKKYTKAHSGKAGSYPSLDTITYDVTDPVILNQALFHKELVEKIKNPVIFPYETVCILEEKTVTAVLKKIPSQSLEPINLAKNFKNLMKLYSRSLSVLQKLEENNATLASFDTEGILCENYTQLKPFILADIYKIGDKRYVTTYEYLAQSMLTSPNADNFGKKWGANVVEKSLNAKLMTNYILKQPYMTRYQFAVKEDIDKLDKFMMNMYKFKSSVDDMQASDSSLKSLIAYIAPAGDTSLLTKPKEIRSPIPSPNPGDNKKEKEQKKAGTSAAKK